MQGMAGGVKLGLIYRLVRAHKTMAKPSGVSGAFRAQVDVHGRVVGVFEQIPYSRQKAEVERQMAAGFIESMNKHLAANGESFFLSEPRQNVENDYDFTVSSYGRPADLELMEIAPLKGPYEAAPHSYRPYEFAKAILSGITAKSGHYSRASSPRELFLLLYVTHWSFLPSESALACLRYWCAREPHVFSAIFVFHFLDSIEGVPSWIFPYPTDLLVAFDPEGIRENVCVNLDPRKFEVRQG